MPDPTPYLPNVPKYDYQALTGEERRAIIINDLPNAINQGINQTQALLGYREVGLGIRPEDFNPTFKQVSQDMASRAVPGITQAWQIPLTDDTTNWARSPLEGNSTYRYKENVEISFFDTASGEVITRLHAVYHNEPLTVGEIQAEALSFYAEESNAEVYQREALSASLSQSFINTSFVTNTSQQP